MDPSTWRADLAEGPGGSSFSPFSFFFFLLVGTEKMEAPFLFLFLGEHLYRLVTVSYVGTTKARRAARFPLPPPFSPFFDQNSRARAVPSFFFFLS